MQRSNFEKHETHLQGVTNFSVPCGSHADRAGEGRRENFAQGSGTSESLVEEKIFLGR